MKNFKKKQINSGVNVKKWYNKNNKIKILLEKFLFKLNNLQINYKKYNK